MDDKQSKLLIGVIALLVAALAVWYFFGMRGPRSGVADLPKPPESGRKAPGPPPSPGGGGGPSAD